MSRPKKYVYVVQGKYDPMYGWEEVTTEETRKEAQARLKEYRENEPQYRHRIRRILNKD